MTVQLEAGPAYEALFDFEGYGTSNARYVFIGLQEKASGSPARQLRNLDTRRTHEAYQGRTADRATALAALIAANAVSKSKADFDEVDQWGIAARIVAGLEGTSIEAEYARLGAATDGVTWLTEALPIPMVQDSSEAWTAVPLPDRVKPTWESYRAKEMQRSRTRLRAAVEGSTPPHVIVAYGWPVASAVADEFSIHAGYTAVRNGRPLLFAAVVRETIIVGTPFFIDGRKNCFGRSDALRIVDIVHSIRNRPPEFRWSTTFPSSRITAALP